MAVGKEIETRGHVVGFRDEISKAAAASDDAFFTWFDGATDKDAAFVRGSWDFTVHVAQPASRYLSDPEGKTALEIGHGGGRILAAASRHFRGVVGVDVHNNNEKVADELRQRGISNFRLLESDGRSIPVEGDTIDLVYSFIVLQHVERIDVFNRYVHETHRVLKPGAVAVLYFGRRYAVSQGRASRTLYAVDRLAERVLVPRGFIELPARVNCTNLVVSLSYAKALARRCGFEVLSTLVSRKRVPNGTRLYGGQNGLVLRKSK